MLGKVNVNPSKERYSIDILVKDRTKVIQNYSSSDIIIPYNINTSLCSNIQVGGG